MVEAQYRAACKTKKSILNCMRKVSSWIMFYGQVLDMLSQHHPEYVSLAWGATKFVLMVCIIPSQSVLFNSNTWQGVLNHERIGNQLSQGLLDISNLLPQSELHAKLYPTERMKASMSQLYACLLLFLRDTVRWFSRSSTGRVISAVFEPFELKRKDLIERIRACAMMIDGEASAASKAELRGLHEHVEYTGKSITVLGTRMDEIHNVHQTRLDSIDTKLQNICAELQDIRGVELKDIRNTVGDTRNRVVSLQYHDLLRKLAPKTLPEDSLGKGLSLIRRAPDHFYDENKAEQAIALRHWLEAPDSPLLVLEAAPIAQLNAKAIALEFLESLETTFTARLWHLAHTGQDEEELSHTAVLRSLIFQVLTLAPELLTSNTADLDAVTSKGHCNEAQWMDLLCGFISQLPRCFLLLESRCERGLSHKSEESLGFLESLVSRCEGSTTVFKALLIGSNASVLESSSCRGRATVMRVRWQAPPPPHMRHCRPPKWSGIPRRQ